MAETTKEYVNKRVQALLTERSSWDAHWRDIAQYLAPRDIRFNVTDDMKGEKARQFIINGQGSQSLRSATAGLLAGVMSPTRQWFSLVTPDPDLMEFLPVQEWLHKVELLISTIFSSSNLYTMAPVLLRGLLAFGTGAMCHVDDFDSVCRFYTYPTGSYVLAQNDKFEVDTLGYQLRMTARQLVDRFGSNVSTGVRNAYDKGNYEERFSVTHFVEPNKDADPTKLESKFKAFRSIMTETNDSSYDRLLSEKGFDEFPVHAPRWDVTGEDVYATDCPGMTTIGDVRALQTLEKTHAQAVAKVANPPLRGPAALRNVPVNALPGGLTVYDGQANGEKLEALYNVNPQSQQLLLVIQHHEARIKQGFYEDLFRSIDSMEGVQPQNQLFLSMKNAEKLLQLGPVLERLHGEFLNKMVDRVFAQCLRAGILPPAPPELQGKALRTRYISSLAMAQREVATVGIDKLTMYIGGLVQAGMTSALDKFDSDQAIDEYARAIGVPPRLVVPDEVVAAKRQQAQKMQQMAQMAELAKTASEAAGNAGGAVNDIASARQTAMGAK